LLAEPFLTLGVLPDLCWGFLDFLADGLASSFLSAGGVLTDSGVNFSPELLHVLDFSGSEALLPIRELSLECTSVLLLELVVVVLDVGTENVVLVALRVKFGLLFLFDGDLLTTLVGLFFHLDDLEAGEALFGVGDGETTVGGTLHSTEDTVTGGGADETDIKESSHRALAFLMVIDGVVLSAINFFGCLCISQQA